MSGWWGSKEPSGVPFELWGQRGSGRMEVAGESFHQKEIARVVELAGGTVDETGTEISATARLVPEPQNKHDPNAVRVDIGGLAVGHLPREDAARHSGILAQLTAAGSIPQVGAQVWARKGAPGQHGSAATRGGIWARVTLDLAEPHLLIPRNAAPRERHADLPVGRGVQVSGEDKHMETLLPYLVPEGECWVHLTLVIVAAPAATKSGKPVIEVRLDGLRVGQLSPQMSAEYLPIVELLEQQGISCCVRGTVKGNKLKADVVVHGTKASALTESWISRALAPATDPRADGVPAPAPPAGWYPDPAGGSSLRWWDGRGWTGHLHGMTASST